MVFETSQFVIFKLKTKPIMDKKELNININCMDLNFEDIYTCPSIKVTYGGEEIDILSEDTPEHIKNMVRTQLRMWCGEIYHCPQSTETVEEKIRNKVSPFWNISELTKEDLLKHNIDFNDLMLTFRDNCTYLIKVGKIVDKYLPSGFDINELIEREND